MKKIIIVLIIIIIAGTVLLLAKNSFREKNSSASNSDVSTGAPVANVPAAVENKNFPQDATLFSDSQNIATEQNSSGFQAPLDRAAERVTKKPFGIFITPQTSPVQPDKFQGYHTGTDFEIFPEEEDVDVPVRAICDGKLTFKKSATGYGGVAVQNCEIERKSVTVVYGHLKLASISKKAGENLQSSETIGILGKGFSSETDGERKHLHLGIHKGTSVNILGYVSSKSELSGWLDPCDFVCK